MVETRPRVAVVYGTRPEAIKLAPVIHRLRSYRDLEVITVSSGQHYELLEPVVQRFGIECDFQLPPMTEGRGLNQLVSSVVAGLDNLFAQIVPDAILVQGDTTTAFSAALVGFHCGAKVIHLEAGLRTGDIRAPFPEEANRKLISQIADLHCAPSFLASKNLIEEGVPEKAIVVTGNTVLDALYEATQWEVHFSDPRLEQIQKQDRPAVLVTAHRRENLHYLENIARAIQILANRFPKIVFVLVLHANPKIRDVFIANLSGIENIILSDALPYDEFIALLRRSELVITDSGGLQEEAPALGIPVILMRDKTERTEVLDSGAVQLVGTDVEHIVYSASRFLSIDGDLKTEKIEPSPYGEGRASFRVAEAIHQLLGMAPQGQC